MKKIILLALFTIYAFSSVISATVVSEAKAAQTAIGFLQKLIPGQSNIQIVLTKTISSAQSCNFFVFTYSQGFVIVAGDNRLFPIVAFSMDGNPDENILPPALLFWLNAITEKTQKQYETRANALWKNQAWQEMGKGTFQFPQTGIEPMLQTIWNQGCYYNSLLPDDSSGPCDHPYTGCVATTLSQIMNYFHYPKNGLGSHGYYSTFGWLEVDFENTNYDWVNMETVLNGENEAVAELMLQSAVSVNSQFLQGGTGAYDADGRNALVNFFGYDSTAQFLWRNGYTGDWDQLIKSELDAGRPVIYGGVDQSSGVGHTFICDGYMNDFFHINWGWGGTYNGYFYLDTLTPQNYHFDFQHDAIIGIKPAIDDPTMLFPPEDLTAGVDGHTVNLAWQKPSQQSSLELLGYNVYRNDSLLNTSVLTLLSFVDENVPSGDQVYSVETVFIGSGDGPATETAVHISGIKETSAKYYTIYPNPSSKTINIRLPKPQSPESTIEIYSPEGRKVFQYKFTLPGKQILQIQPSLPPGFYLLRYSSGYYQFTDRIVIL